MKVTVTDGYSPSANPRRGYHDNVCTVRVEGVPEDEALQIVEFFHRRIRDRGGYMWCHPPSRHPDTAPDDKGMYWSFRHGFDSGD